VSDTETPPVIDSPSWWNLPNQITISRIVLAFVLFIILSLELAGASPIGDRARTLWVATILFVVCVSTDWLDGMLARKLDLVTAFGRIVDPFADKLLVLGTLIFLIPLTDSMPPWFVVVLLAREFLVSGLRSYLESRGIPFGARWGGKIKMILQSILIPVLLADAAMEAGPGDGGVAAAGLPDLLGVVLLHATLLATLISLLDYLKVAVRSTAAGRGGP
jgi:CDP-diacylglycerol--glycerol-3-phosphate 3-phosphatidyltransferase